MMPRVVGNLRTAAIISSALVVPFTTLELVNRWRYHEGFPFPLFALMWLCPFLFIIVLGPMLRIVTAGVRDKSALLGLALKGALLCLTAWLWIGLVLDQVPCFLGVPLCD